jgi:ADP-heptose:LPS heptosyltransferase
MPKFLIIRFSSIGDIVLTSPVVRCLKNQVKDAEVHYVTKHSYKEIIENSPDIDKKIYFDDNLFETIKVLRKENYDYIIDLHKNVRSFIIKLLLLKKSFSFNKLNFEKWLMVNFKLNLLPDVHIVDRYLDAVKSFNVINDGEGLDYFLGQDLSDQLETHPEKFIAFVIGGAHFTKRLPAEKIYSICKEIKEPVFFFSGREDHKAILDMQKALPDKVIYNFCGKTSINETAAYIKRSQAVITNDTGFMHVAAAFKKKIISVWGNTIPQFGMYPYYGNYKIENSISEVLNLSCRPCSKIGYEKCPLGHFKCMREINDEEILKNLEVKTS